MNSTTQLVSRTRKPRGQGASRRGEILQAAKRQFLEHGVSHVTMRGIAAEIGVSATALYVYFPDKDSILQAIAEESFRALLEAHAASVDPQRSAMENLRAGLRAYVEFARSHSDEYQLVFLTGGRKAQDPCRSISEADMSFALLLAGVQAVIDEGLFPPKPALLLAEALWACMHGVVALLLVLADVIESDPDALVNQVLDMAVTGLMGPPR